MALILGLYACTGSWVNPGYRASLVIGAPVVTGTHGEVLISVAEMPEGGMASLAVDLSGMSYDNLKIKDVAIKGLNGFIVLAREFNDSIGEGRFVIANPNAGSVGGPVAKLLFNVAGSLAPGDLLFDRGHITIGSHLNTLITDWELITGKAYYAK